jgi:acetylornithine deacetylase/succinyl-diaminopimelate desuccinylase-like protein
MVALLSHSLDTLESLHSRFPNLTANPLLEVELEMYGRRLGMLHTLLLMHTGANPTTALADIVSQQAAEPGSLLHPQDQGTFTTVAPTSGFWETWEWVKDKVIFVKEVVIADSAAAIDDFCMKGIPLVSGMFTAADTIEKAGTTADGRPIFGEGLKTIMYGAKFGDDAMSTKQLLYANFTQADVDAMFNCRTPPAKPRRQLRAFPVAAGQSQLGPVFGGHGTCNTDEGTCKCDLGWGAVPDCTYKEGGDKLTAASAPALL